jgi:putative lipase involved disintegration of autophagic bodies
MNEIKAPIFTTAKEMSNISAKTQDAKREKLERKRRRFAAKQVAKAERIARTKGWTSYTFEIPRSINEYALQQLFEMAYHQYTVEVKTIGKKKVGQLPKKAMTIKW